MRIFINSILIPKFKENKMPIEDKLTATFLGMALGILGTIIGVGFVMEPIVNEVKVFQREKKPAIMRLYKQPGIDKLMVQDLENDGKYIPLSNYLKKIKDTADKQIEKATIKKIAEWYEPSN
jgi:hypothetical protein